MINKQALLSSWYLDIGLKSNTAGHSRIPQAEALVRLQSSLFTFSLKSKAELKLWEL